MGHMGCPYNDALCERNVGNEATSLLVYASPELQVHQAPWASPLSRVPIFPKSHAEGGQGRGSAAEAC